MNLKDILDEFVEEDVEEKDEEGKHRYMKRLESLLKMCMIPQAFEDGIFLRRILDFISVYDQLVIQLHDVNK
jgi:hypothetical protein